MNTRLKQLRTKLDLTLEKFGEQLGVTKATISRLEKGERKITEQMFVSICREFNVNEIWFRTGEGEMFLQPDRKSEINKLTQQLLSEESDSFKNRFINMLANLSVNEWKLLEKIAKELVETPSVDEEPSGQLRFELDTPSKIQESPEQNKSSSELEKDYEEATYKKNRSSFAKKEVFTASNTTDVDTKNNDKNIVNK